MKNILSTLLLAATTMAHGAVKIDKIEPANWYAGMKNPKLQLMVYGQGVSQATVSTDYQGVRIDSVVHLDSPNYLFVYLDIADAPAGTMKLNFQQGKSRKTMDYELRQREMPGEKRMGFTSKDVLYMLMPDRFAQGAPHTTVKGLYPYTVNRNEPSLRHGGDLEGIRQHLDYFTDLGVTALWLTPVLENNIPDHGTQSSYHGYATTDYYRVDPRFGSNADYRRLIDEAHQKGLKVVMDMIFNHCGFNHPWLTDLPSRDWLNLPECLDRDAKGNVSVNDRFLQTSYKLTPVLDPYASQVDLDETVKGWFVAGMPDLNQRNEHLMTYLIQNSVWWVETVGIDGIRMDTYPYAYAEGMARWMRTLQLEYPNFNVVGETWVTEPAYTAAWQKDSRLAKDNSFLPSVMDFSFFDKLNQAKTEETDEWWKGYNRIYNSFVYDYLYPNPSMVMAFIENHDTDRFLADGMDIPALKQAMALLLTINRIPQLYYGTEVLMNGSKEITDGHVRRDFPGFLASDPVNAFTGQGLSAAQRDMLEWTRRLLHWRQQSEAVAQGRQVQFIPVDGVYVIARQHEGRTVLTVLNGTRKPATLRVQRYKEVIGSARQATDILTSRTVSLASDLALDPQAVHVLEF